jgi:hypothetical protein
MDLEARVIQLEQRWRRLVLLSAVGIILVALAAFRRANNVRIPQEIVARSFRVVGEAGKNEAVLAATPDGFVVLTFKDLKDSLRFAAMMTPSGKVTLSWLGDQGPRAEIGVIDGKAGEEFSMELRDKDGRKIWQIPVSNIY